MPRLVDVRPALRRIRTGAQALGLGPRELLHAGPPLEDPRRPPHSLASAIVLTCLHEGWASDEASVEALLRDGGVSLSPAQDRRCVTPLAAVVSANTPLLEVGDAASGMAPCFAPVSAVRGVDTRMGFRDPAVFGRLRHRDTVTAPALSRWLEIAGPLALWPMAASGLAAGDDLHSSTQNANLALAGVLQAGGAATTLVDDVAASPLFFLTLWMAACALMLRAAEGSGNRSLVTRAGGNGERFAIALAGQPDHWTTCRAEPPAGPRLSSIAGSVAVEGAIGDSAVIDMLGLGGQRLAHAPELRELFQEQLAAIPQFESVPAQRLLTLPQTLLQDHWPLGLDAKRVAALAQRPLIMLAMLGQDGRTGFCGRGIYQPPLSLFEEACREQ